MAFKQKGTWKRGNSCNFSTVTLTKWPRLSSIMERQFILFIISLDQKLKICLKIVDFGCKHLKNYCYARYVLHYIYFVPIFTYLGWKLTQPLPTSRENQTTTLWNICGIIKSEKVPTSGSEILTPKRVL